MFEGLVLCFPFTFLLHSYCFCVLECVCAMPLSLSCILILFWARSLRDQKRSDWLRNPLVIKEIDDFLFFFSSRLIHILISIEEQHASGDMQWNDHEGRKYDPLLKWTCLCVKPPVTNFAHILTNNIF